MGEDLLCSASELMCEEHFDSLIHTFPRSVSRESAGTVLMGWQQSKEDCLEKSELIDL